MFFDITSNGEKGRQWQCFDGHRSTKLDIRSRVR